jgi:hypothetical protein
MDRIIHNLTPILACVILVGGGAALIAEEPLAPFAIAGSSALFFSRESTEPGGKPLR